MFRSRGFIAVVREKNIVIVIVTCNKHENQPKEKVMRSRNS